MQQIFYKKCKECLKYQIQKDNPTDKQNIWTLHKRTILVASKHMKTCAALLIIKEVKLKFKVIPLHSQQDERESPSDGKLVEELLFIN